MKVPALIVVPVTLLAVLIALPAQAVVVSTENLPPAQIVQETRDQLLAAGCVEGPLGDGLTADVPPGKPYRVAARDRAAESIAFCSPEVASSLTVIEGEVAALYDYIDCNGISGYLIPSCYVYGAVKTVVQNDSMLQSLVGGVAEGLVGPAAAEMMEVIAPIVAAVGMVVLRFALQLLVFSLATPTFITNPLVETGWPFVQGIANLGFMLALLFIAFATTLRLEGFSAARQLPRLLIAAVLINFSLIIAGVIIDITRVIMAILVNTLGNVSLDQLPAFLLANSGILEAVVRIETFGLGRYDAAAVAIYNAVVVWALALGFLTIALTLVVRYIALILLLIVSPVAYLGFALPNTEPYAKQWWTTFFKFVFAGPIALFFLILAIQIGKVGEGTFEGGGGDFTAGGKALQAITLTAMLIIAAVASLKMADKGSSATVGAFSKQMKKTGLWSGKKAAKAWYVGTGTRWAGRQIGDARRAATDKLRTRSGAAGDVFRTVTGPKRDPKTGRIMPGQAKTVAQRFGERVGGVGSGERAESQARAARASAAGVALAAKHAGKDPTAMGDTERMVRHDDMKAVMNDPAHRDEFTPANLKKGGVLEAMQQSDSNSVKAIVETGDRAQVEAVLKNKDFIKTLGDSERAELVVAIENNVNYRDAGGNEDRTGVDDAKAKSQLIETLDKTLDAIKKERTGGTG